MIEELLQAQILVTDMVLSLLPKGEEQENVLEAIGNIENLTEEEFIGTVIRNIPPSHWQIAMAVIDLWRGFVCSAENEKVVTDPEHRQWIQKNDEYMRFLNEQSQDSRE